MKLAAVLALAGATAQVPQASSVVEPREATDARVVLSLDKPEFLLGEQVLVHYCLENVSNLPFEIELGGDNRAASRSHRFKFTVTASDGAIVPDPDPQGFHLGGLSTTPEVLPGTRRCQSLNLMRYARIDRPGTYSIRVAHDLGWKKTPAPIGEVTVALAMPGALEAARVVDATLALPNDAGLTVGELSTPVQDFSTLRYPLYLAPLRTLADHGNKAVLAAIGGIPTPEATRALIELMKHPDRTLARDAARYLAMRLPDPALDGTLPRRGPFNNEQEDPRRYLRDAGWRPELAADVRALAHAWLAAPEAELVTQAAFMIEAVGGAADAPVLSAALDRALERSLTLPFEAGGYPRPRGAMAELMRAAEVVIARGHAPTARPATPGEAALWLTAFGSGARPAGWEARLGELLEHRIPYIRELALKRLPADAPVDLFHAVESALQSADVDLQMAALDVVGRARLTAHRDAVAALVETVTDRMLRNAASNALHAIAGPLPPLEIAANRLVEPAQFNECVSTLIFGVLEARGAGGGPVSSEEAQNLSKRWKAFLAAHRSELEAGRRWAIDDPAVAGLIPSTWTVRPRAG